MQNFAYVVGTFSLYLLFKLFINQKLVLSEILHWVILILVHFNKEIEGHSLHTVVGSSLTYLCGNFPTHRCGLSFTHLCGTSIFFSCGDIHSYHARKTHRLFGKKFPSLLILPETTAESINCQGMHIL